VDRPLFYAVAVIVAGFLPIYVLSGPSGTLFKPMADTMVFALVGSLLVTLTLLPVLCAWFMRNGVRERRNAAFEAIKSAYTRGLDFFSRASLWDHAGVRAAARRFAAAHPAHRRRVHAAPR
jgi:cobalt-zinc-cadmium resistance protein CzcA